MQTTKIDGLQFLNCTPHPITIQNRNGELIQVEKSGLTLKAQPVESLVHQDGDITLVTTVFQPSEEGKEELKKAKETGADVIIGSIISAQAFGPDVKSLVPVPGYERAAPADKRFLGNKFNVFPKLQQLAKDLNIQI